MGNTFLICTKIYKIIQDLLAVSTDVYIDLLVTCFWISVKLHAYCVSVEGSADSTVTCPDL